jgi:hypothetical protein
MGRGRIGVLPGVVCHSQSQSVACGIGQGAKVSDILVEFYGGPLNMTVKQFHEEELLSGEIKVPMVENKPAAIYMDDSWQWAHVVEGIYEVHPPQSNRFPLKTSAKWAGIQIVCLGEVQAKG